LKVGSTEKAKMLSYSKGKKDTERAFQMEELIPGSTNTTDTKEVKFA